MAIRVKLDHGVWVRAETVEVVVEGVPVKGTDGGVCFLLDGLGVATDVFDGGGARAASRREPYADLVHKLFE